MQGKLLYKSISMSFVGSYLNLIKPRIVVLFALTGVVSVLVDIVEPLSLLTVLVVGVSLALTAASANAFNMYIDRDIDKVMERTKYKRVIPLGIRTGEDALKLGFICAVLTSFLLFFTSNLLAIFLSIFTIIFYAIVYTILLKRNTHHNTFIGGVPGAMAPIIGSAIVTGSISPLAFALFGIIMCWQPPHFWALAITLKDDYKKANIPMLPVVFGEKYTRKSILFYTIVLIPTSYAPYFIGKAGLFYIAAVSILNMTYLFKTIRMLQIKKHVYCKHLFHVSILYITYLFIFLMLDAFFLDLSNM